MNPPNIPAPPEGTEFNLAEGETYVTRNGDYHVKVRRCDTQRGYPFKGDVLINGNAAYWTEMGRFNLNQMGHPLDLVRCVKQDALNFGPAPGAFRYFTGGSGDLWEMPIDNSTGRHKEKNEEWGPTNWHLSAMIGQLNEGHVTECDSTGQPLATPNLGETGSKLGGEPLIHVEPAHWRTDQPRPDHMLLAPNPEPIRTIYEALPADVKRKVSCHDLKRIHDALQGGQEAIRKAASPNAGDQAGVPVTTTAIEKIFKRVGSFTVEAALLSDVAEQLERALAAQTARAEKEIDRGRTWCSDFIAMRKERDALAAEVRGLREALEDIAKHGTRCDLTPTLLFRGDTQAEKDRQHIDQLYGWIRTMDDAVKRAAAQALAGKEAGK